MAMVGFSGMGSGMGGLGLRRTSQAFVLSICLWCMCAYVLVHVCEYIDMRTQMSFQSPGQDLGCHLLSVPYCLKTGSLPEQEVWLGWLA